MNTGTETALLSGVSYDLNWLALCIERLLENHTPVTLALPQLTEETAYSKLVSEYNLSEPERVVLSNSGKAFRNGIRI